MREDSFLSESRRGFRADMDSSYLSSTSHGSYGNLTVVFIINRHFKSIDKYISAVISYTMSLEKVVERVKFGNKSSVPFCVAGLVQKSRSHYNGAFCGQQRALLAGQRK